MQTYSLHSPIVNFIKQEGFPFCSKLVTRRIKYRIKSKKKKKQILHNAHWMLTGLYDNTKSHIRNNLLTFSLYRKISNLWFAILTTLLVSQYGKVFIWDFPERPHSQSKSNSYWTVPFKLFMKSISVILLLTLGLCRSVFSITMANARIRIVSTTPFSSEGLHWTYCSAKS